MNSNPIPTFTCDKEPEASVDYLSKYNLSVERVYFENKWYFVLKNQDGDIKNIFITPQLKSDFGKLDHQDIMDEFDLSVFNGEHLVPDGFIEEIKENISNGDCRTYDCIIRDIDKGYLNYAIEGSDKDKYQSHLKLVDQDTVINDGKQNTADILNIFEFTDGSYDYVSPTGKEFKLELVDGKITSFTSDTVHLLTGHQKGAIQRLINLGDSRRFTKKQEIGLRITHTDNKSIASNDAEPLGVPLNLKQQLEFFKNSFPEGSTFEYMNFEDMDYIASFNPGSFEPECLAVSNDGESIDIKTAMEDDLRGVAEIFKTIRIQNYCKKIQSQLNNINNTYNFALLELNRTDDRIFIIGSNGIIFDVGDINSQGILTLFEEENILFKKIESECILLRFEYNVSEVNELKNLLFSVGFSSSQLDYIVTYIIEKIPKEHFEYLKNLLASYLDEDIIVGIRSIDDINDIYDTLIKALQTFISILDKVGINQLDRIFGQRHVSS